MAASHDQRGPGKVVGGYHYLHVSALGEADADFRSAVERGCELVSAAEWNVAKVGRGTVSLLLYEDFDEVAFPALLRSTAIGLQDGSVRATDYVARANPPILHRKETLLRHDDDRRKSFAALTRSAEEHGLFAQPTRIGNRREWLKRLADGGLEIHGQELRPVSTIEAPRRMEPEVARHKTAIVRRDLSQPVQLMLSNGVLSKGATVFDYGCGQGDDVATLTANGFEAFGWDPHHAPDGQRDPADIVNLGFVLNVIEDPEERTATLNAAWTFARRAMVVSSMIVGKADVSGLRPYRDGFLTSRGTFQKYFGHPELRAFIQDTVGERPIGLGPGIFAVFRDKDLEQEVLLRRRSLLPGPVVPIALRERELTERVRAQRRVAQAKPSLAERLGDELQSLWRLGLSLGRVPDANEVPEEISSAFQSARISLPRAFAICLEREDRSELEAASRMREQDLLVHLALTIFPGAPRYTTLPASIQRDIRAFMGSHATAMSRARSLLFSAGNAEEVRSAAKAAVAVGLGGFRDERTFRFQATALNRLPALLRVMVGCATVLQADVETADIIDIKLGVPRLNVIMCDDFTKSLPRITGRVRVDLGRQRMRHEPVADELLYLKGRYLTADDPAREKQIEFDLLALATGLVNEAGSGPPFSERNKILSTMHSLMQAGAIGQVEP